MYNLLIHGGTTTSGRACTVSVVGAYWMSSMSSFRYTTEPLLAATLTPTVNAFLSTSAGRPLLSRASSMTLRAPRCRFCPPVFIVSSITAGLRNGKFVGLIASQNCLAKNFTRDLVSASTSERSMPSSTAFVASR